MKDIEAAFTEPHLDTMSKPGLRHYQAPTLAHDYTKELQPQLDVWKTKIEKLAKLNESLRMTAVFHVEGGAGNIGGGAWDLWLLIRDFDTQLTSAWISILATRRSRADLVWEAIRFMHRNAVDREQGHPLGEEDRHAARTAAIRSEHRLAMDRRDVVPGEGMVLFKMAFDT